MKRKKQLTDFQRRLVEVINRNTDNSTTELAWRLKTSRLAVWSAMRSLEEQGLAGYFRSGNGDRWSASMWFLRGSLSKQPKC